MKRRLLFLLAMLPVRKTIKMTTLMILTLMLFCVAACSLAPDVSEDVYVKYEPNIEDGFDKAVIEKQAEDKFLATMRQDTSAGNEALVVDNSNDPDAMHDFLTTEETGQAAIWRDFEMKSSEIGIEKEGIRLDEFGVAYDDILMVSFVSSEPISTDVRPNIVITTPLPTTRLEEEYCRQEEGQYITVYSVIMERKIPYLSEISLVQIELMGREYVFRYHWDWRQPEFAKTEEQLQEWVAEAALHRSSYREDIEHTLTPVILEDPELFRVELNRVSAQKNLLTAEGSIDVLADIKDEYHIGWAVEVNGELLRAGTNSYGFKRLGDLKESTSISPEKKQYQIGRQWELPFYYENIHGIYNQVAICIELRNQTTGDMLYYHFPYRI